MRLLTFAGITLPDPDAEQDIPINARSSLVNLRHGAFDQDGAENVFRSNSLRLRAMLEGQRIDEQADTLWQAADRGRALLRAQLRDDRLRVTYAKVSYITRTVNVDTYDCRQPFVMNFTQDYPFWLTDGDYDYLDDGHTLDEAGLTLDGGNFISTVMTGSPHTVSVAYGGTAKGIYGAFCFQPRAGASLTNIVVQNLANGMSFAYDGTVAAEKRLDIHWGDKTVQYRSSDAYENFRIPSTKQTDWFRLENTLGNNIKITATVVGTSDIYIQFPRLYL